MLQSKRLTNLFAAGAKAAYVSKRVIKEFVQGPLYTKALSHPRNHFIHKE